MYQLEDYDYILPEALIAQAPAQRRDQSRLMALERRGQTVSHRRFADLVEILKPGDLLVVNDTRVVPCRLTGFKETGGKVQVLILDFPHDLSRADQTGEVTCNCLVKASKPPKPGSELHFEDRLQARIVGGSHGAYQVTFQYRGGFASVLDEIGRAPLPPYIRRNGKGSAPCDDRKAYQTVYARKDGAVAAPTAGLHFSNTLLRDLEAKGVAVAAITLHVGHGTFLPVRVKDIRDHRMHAEAYELSPGTAQAVNRTKAAAGRVIAVGSTATRVLEFSASQDGRVEAGSGMCDLFIYPGCGFRVVDGLITNFHLPKSTLLMLVSAFADRSFVLDAYREAIGLGYRFYSYGDAMLIL